MKSFGCAGLVVGAVCLLGCGSTARGFDPASDAGASGEGGAATGGSSGGGGSPSHGGGSAGSVSHGGSSGAVGDESNAGAAAVAGAESGGGAAGAGAGGAPGAGASAGGAPGAGANAGGAAAVDTTPPKVLSILPANGAKGITSDAKIVITFSESVDKASAQAALTSSAGNLTYAWNADSTVLTATPVTALPYGAGATATSFTVQISTGLEDLANNQLSAAFSSSFSTLRQISLKISRPVTGTYVVSDYPSASAVSGDSSPVIGDGFGNEAYRAVPDFDISALPNGITSIASATLSVPISVTNVIAADVPWGSPLTTLGNLNVYHVYDQPITTSTFDKTALSSVGTLMTSAVPTTGTKTISVTASVQDDYNNRAARSNHSMYRLQFPQLTDNDAALDFVGIPFSQNMTIDVVYLIQ